MFFENGRISAQQIFRMAVVEFLGITIVTVPLITGKMCGRDGLIAIFLSGASAILYVLLVLKLCEKMSDSLLEELDKKGYKKTGKIIAGVLGGKYLASMVVSMFLLSNMVRQLLLSCYRSYIVVIPMALLLLYSLTMNVESRARFYETIYYFVVIPAIIVILISCRKCDRWNITPLFMGNIRSTIGTAFIYTIIFCPAEILLFSRKHFSADKEIKKYMVRAVIINTLFGMIYFILNVGVYGINGYLSGNYLSIMQTVGHIESITSLFLIISMFGAVNCYAVYTEKMCVHFFNGKTDYKYLCRWVPVIIAAIMASAGVMNGMMVSFATEISRRPDIEDRDYIRAMGIDYNRGRYDVWYQIANGKTLYWYGENMLSASEEYEYMTSGSADFSHMSVIVLGKSVLESKKAAGNVADFMKLQSQIAKDMLVVSTEGKASDIAGVKGSDVAKMFHNNLPFFECQSYQYVDVVKEKYKCILMGMVSGEKNPECQKAVILGPGGEPAILDINEAKLIALANKEMTGQTFKINNVYQYRVIENHYDVSLNIINRETVGVNITLTGDIKDLSGNKITKNRQLEMIEQEISKEINDNIYKNNMDYFRIYDRLSVSDRGLWVKYMENRKGFYNRIYYNVLVKYRIN